MPSVWNRPLSRALSILLAGALSLGGAVVATPAAAEELVPGTISGSVVDAEGVAIPGVDVWAYPQTDGAAVMTSSSADGSFSITSVPEGDYALVFRLRVDGTELSEWWNNASSRATATPVTVTSGGIVDDIDIVLAESDGSTLEDYTAAVSGVVTGAGGQPLAGVSVAMQLADRPAGETVSTDADGHWSFGSRAAGRYVLSFRTVIDGVEVVEFWDDAADVTDATVVTLARGEQVTGLATVLELPAAPELESSVPTIVGTARVGETLSAQTGTWTSGVAFSYQWAVDGAPVAGATASTFAVPANSVGKVITVAVTGSKDGFPPVTETSSPTAPVAAAVLTTATPTIAGTPVVGSTLTAGPGTWTAGTSFTYQWFAHGVAIAGAVEASFIVSSAQLGKAVTVAVTGSKDGFAAATRTSAPTAPVTAVLTTAIPTIAGTPVVGSTLTADPGAWTGGTGFTYQWLANGAAIAGAVEASLLVGPAHVGKVITVAVTGSQAGYDTEVRESSGTSPVAKGTLATVVPTISGFAYVGATLTASPGTWTTGATRTYQWLANGVAISGATGSKLLLTTALKDKQISVRVTGTLAGYTTASETSTLTKKVATVATPKITGSAQLNAKLTAVPGTWTSSTTFAYQWYADGTAIAGATGSTFIPKSAQAAKKITVKVTGSKSGYEAFARTSSSTLKVTAYSTPTVTGTAAVGYTLTAKRNTWSYGMDITYQWYADGAAISGAKSYTLKLAAAQRDKRITVKVTGKQYGFTTVVAPSVPTARVATTSAPSITGVLSVGNTLTAKPNTWTGGTGFTYQWFADGSPISGATRSTHALTSYQRGKQITVTVTGKKSGWATVVRTSSKTLRIAQTAAPSIGGTLIVGSTLSARTGSWPYDPYFSYQWYVNGVAASGATGSTFTLNRSHIGKAIRVTVVGKKTGYQTFTRSSASTGSVSSGKSAPATKDNCPSAFPIKGNQTTQHTTDWIYHVPGGRYYAVTDPEECFATATAAVAWGYRASQQ